MEVDKARKDFSVNSVGGISRVTSLEIKSEGHPMRRKKESGDLKGSIQKTGRYSGKKVSLVTLTTTAISESKKRKSG